MMTPSNKISITNVVGHNYLIVSGMHSKCLYAGQKYQSYPEIQGQFPLSSVVFPIRRAWIECSKCGSFRF